MADTQPTPSDAELIEHARTAGWHEPEKAPEFVAAYRAHVEQQSAAVAALTAEEATANATANAATVSIVADVHAPAACKCGHPQDRHALLSGTYAQCRTKYAEAGRPKCPCGMFRPQADPTTVEDQSTGDVFTEAAVSRNALLAGITAIENLPQDFECDPGRGDAVKVLHRLADHYTTNEQPAGLTWEARTAHAVRLYATTAIERDDARTEAAKLREQLHGGAELEQPTDGTERAEDTARRFARRLAAVEQLCNGRPGYHQFTVKALLTAMSDADDGPEPVSDDVLTERMSTAIVQYLNDVDEDPDTDDLADNLLTVIKQAGR
ncbi:hypothetical protein [Streptomyces sp. NPDC096323]|uniref:hypothetical protein n=1 Tax=Streptomyces sp. NPDC096323 TaxID=3155822 RepID=UPI00331E300F